MTRDKIWIEIPRKPLSFDPEILTKHLAYSQEEIWTVRRHAKGDVGELFLINDEVWVLVELDLVRAMEYCMSHAAREGFKDGYELYDTLKEIYPALSDRSFMYSHKLIKLHGVEV